jgi:hypothetical protein
MMTKLVEKVARAIAEAHNGQFRKGRIWESMLPQGRDWWRQDAKAAIAIIQEIMNTQKRPGMGEGRAFSLVQAKIDVARDIAAAIRALGESDEQAG